MKAVTLPVWIRDRKGIWRLSRARDKRHSCACHILQSGTDINTIRAWLGHVSLATTNIYAEVDLKAKEEAMRSTCPDDSGDKP